MLSKEPAQQRRGGSALSAARRRREVDTERLVNRARQFAVVLGIVQFGLFTDYLPGTRTAGLLIAAGYGLTAWWSGRVMASEPEYGRLRQLTSITLGLDAAMLSATVLVLAYQSDPTNLLLMVIALLEGAMKRGLPGAVTLAVVAIITEMGRVAVRVGLHDLPPTAADSTFFAGMLLVLGLFAGGVVRLQVRAQDDLAGAIDRLSTTRRLLRQGLTTFASGQGLQGILQEAVDGFAIDAAVVHRSEGAVVAWPREAGRDPVIPVAVRGLSLVDGDRPELDHVDGAGNRWMALPVDEFDKDAATLVVRLTDEQGIDDARALQAELQALARASVALAVEEEMREARSRLDRLRHDFVAITSHEIRTPVTILRGAVELMRSPSGAGREKELLDSMFRHTNRLARVAEDLQVVQRLDRGAVGVLATRVPVEAILASLLDDADASVNDSIELGLAMDLSAWADSQLLATVLRCLVDNAITHGAGRDIKISGEVEGGTIVVDVSDAGPGIPMQARTRIFERFAAADAGAHRQGAGVGLPLARELARLMDGDVELLDQERTTFRLTLPGAPH